MPSRDQYSPTKLRPEHSWSIHDERFFKLISQVTRWKKGRLGCKGFYRSHRTLPPVWQDALKLANLE